MNRKDACSLITGVAKMCNERKNLLEFKCEGCSLLDWCVDFTDENTLEPWELLLLEDGVIDID